MRVLLLANGADVAGQLHAIKVALAHERPDWHVDQVTRTVRWGYPRQHAFHPRAVRDLWDAADVVHLALSAQAVGTFGTGKPVVIHHQGSEYRSPERRAAADEAAQHVGAQQVVATLDLMGSPGVEWLPAVVDLEAMRGIRRVYYQPSDVIRIAHSPTNPAIKGTAELVRAVGRLQAAGYPVELDVITGVPWAESLRRKARADIFFDQLVLGYGLSAVEAWAMGIPVVAGSTNEETVDRMLDTFGLMPFVRASPVTVYEALEHLLDPDARRLWSQVGTEHVERFHSHAAVVERLAGIYQRAMTA